MHAPKTKELETTKTADELFNVVLGVVQNGKFELLALSNEKQKLAFISGKTALSWGQEYVVKVAASTDGKTTLHLLCGSHKNAPKALMDGWKNGKAADKVIKAVEDAIAGDAKPAQPVESFRITNEAGTTTAFWDGETSWEGETSE